MRETSIYGFCSVEESRAERGGWATRGSELKFCFDAVVFLLKSNGLHWWLKILALCTHLSNREEVREIRAISSQKGSLKIFPLAVSLTALPIHPLRAIPLAPTDLSSLALTRLPLQKCILTRETKGSGQDPVPPTFDVKDKYCARLHFQSSLPLEWDLNFFHLNKSPAPDILLFPDYKASTSLPSLSSFSSASLPLPPPLLDLY